MGALAVQALRVSIPAVIVAMFVGTDVVQNMLAAIPEWVTRGLQVGGGVVVVVGYAMVINMMEAKHLMPFFFLGFVVAAISQLNLVALGIIGVVSAVIYIQLNPKFNTNATMVEIASASNADDELD
jgi:mannose/fructose/N-acetylgalactosamine-specific phosphotransferase system component IIC